MQQKLNTTSLEVPMQITNSDLSKFVNYPRLKSKILLPSSIFYSSKIWEFLTIVCNYMWTQWQKHVLLGIQTSKFWQSNFKVYSSMSGTFWHYFANFSKIPCHIRAHPTTFLGTWSNPFSRFTKIWYNFLWNFSCSCLKMRMASISDLPKQKPKYLLSTLIIP